MHNTCTPTCVNLSKLCTEVMSRANLIVFVKPDFAADFLTFCPNSEPENVLFIIALYFIEEEICGTKHCLYALLSTCTSICTCNTSMKTNLNLFLLKIKAICYLVLLVLGSFLVTNLYWPCR